MKVYIRGYNHYLQRKQRIDGYCVICVCVRAEKAALDNAHLGSGTLGRCYSRKYAKEKHSTNKETTQHLHKCR
jgi:hypothetical protein